MSDLLNRIDLRFDFVAEKLAQHTITEDGCWEYQGQISPDGYGNIVISLLGKRSERRKLRAHRVAYAFYHGIDPGVFMVCHHCDNRRCINPDHLYLGTARANTQDMIARGRAADQSGTRNPGCKVTPEIVLEVVSQIKEGKTNKDIARGLPISHSQVSLIRLGKSWRHLTEQAGYDPEKHRMFRRTGT